MIRKVAIIAQWKCCQKEQYFVGRILLDDHRVIFQICHLPHKKKGIYISLLYTTTVLAMSNMRVFSRLQRPLGLMTVLIRPAVQSTLLQSDVLASRVLTAKPYLILAAARRYQSTVAQSICIPDNNAKNNSSSNSSSSSNPPLSFPCIDKLNSRTAELDNGPEPSYDKVVTGYETFEYPHPFLLDHGGILPKFKIAYETWGKLNEKRDNAILIHTGLSASSHAKSHAKNMKPGWWEEFIGPGSYIDTNKFFVICTNVIGGCYGSTGPSSIDPADGERYATRFPIITIFDMVRAQFLLLDHLGIEKLHASVGSSMGGMQVNRDLLQQATFLYITRTYIWFQSIAAAHLFPDRIKRLVSVSACARSHPYSIALRHTQRQGRQ